MLFVIVVKVINSFFLSNTKDENFAGWQCEDDDSVGDDGVG